jgi:mono/diheme cytochrome c family protein
MAVAAFIAAFVALGIGVVFVAASGGGAAARENYLTRGRTLFRVVFPVLVLVLGLAVPALVIADRKAGEGATGRAATIKPSAKVEKGKELFRSTCWSCHSLAAAGARGNTGPNLDEVGALTKQRVQSAIKNGGTGQGRMPKGLLSGEEADAVGEYLENVAGK